MLSVKYDNTTTLKIDGWLKDTLGHSNPYDREFKQDDKKASNSYETKTSDHVGFINRDKPGETNKGLK